MSETYIGVSVPVSGLIFIAQISPIQDVVASCYSSQAITALTPGGVNIISVRRDIWRQLTKLMIVFPSDTVSR